MQYLVLQLALIAAVIVDLGNAMLVRLCEIKSAEKVFVLCILPTRPAFKVYKKHLYNYHVH